MRVDVLVIRFSLQNPIMTETASLSCRALLLGYNLAGQSSRSI